MVKGKANTKADAEKVGSIREFQVMGHGQGTGSEGGRRGLLPKAQYTIGCLFILLLFHLLLHWRVLGRLGARSAMLICAVLKDHFGNHEKDRLKG